MRLVWILASVVLLAATFCAAADDLQDELSAANDSDPAEWHNKGDALVNLGKYNEALVCYEKAIKLNPNLAYIWSGKGWALCNLGEYDEALVCYEKAIELDPNLAYIWSGKGWALESLNRSAEAAMAYSLGRELELNSETKTGVFAAFLIAYSALAVVGYSLTRRFRNYAMSIVILSINLLGFLAVMWVLSGLFDFLLVGQFFVGGVLMLLISAVLWCLSGFPANPWMNRLVIEIEDFKSTCPHLSWIIRVIVYLAVFTYALIASIFYFRFYLGSESTMVEFIKVAFSLIFLVSLFITLPPIWSAIISKNLDRMSRDFLLIFQFGHLGVSALYLGLILWIFGIGSFGHSIQLGNIKLPISLHFLGIIMSMFLLAIIGPYISGSKRAIRWNVTLLEREKYWLDELLEVLDFPTPDHYITKLQKILDDIKADDTISGKEVDLDRIESSYGTRVLQLDPRSRYRDFLMRLQDKIGEKIDLFEELKGSKEEIKETARIYGEAYRLRRDEIADMIEKEGQFRPKLWIALALVLTPILGQILASLINWTLMAMIESNLGGLIMSPLASPLT